MKFFFTACAFMLASASLACDVCSAFYEITPNDRRSSLGFHYTTLYRNGYPQVFTKHSGHLNLLGNEVKEIFDTYELRGRYAFSEKLFGEVAVPIRNIYQGVNKSQRFDQWGLGDVQVQLSYRPLNRLKEDGWNHRLDLIGGVDLASGKWLDSVNQIVLDPIYQMGSGSFDFWGGFSYVLRYKLAGLSLQPMYRLNTRNAHGFKFGNMVTTDLSLFSLIRKGIWTFVPRAGLFYEYGARNEIKDLYDEFSGGSILSLQLGLSVNYKQVQLNAFIRNAMTQRSNGPEVRQLYVLQVGLIYAFKRKETK